MKYCEAYGELLDLFVDGELTPEDAERVGEHLKNCPGCQAYVDSALAIRAAFPEAEDTAVPDGFAEGVMERIRKDAAREEKAAKLRRRSLRRWMGTAAALAACCALVILVRTGPGNGAAAPAGEETAACDTSGSMDNGGLAGNGELGIAPQMETEAAVPEEAPEQAEIGGMARSKEIFSEDQGKTPPAEVKTTGAAPEAALADSEPHACVKKAALYLTGEEAGDLLDGFAAVWEDGGTRHYELNAGEYQTLLEALGRQEELPETAEGPFLVVVTELQESETREDSLYN